MVFKPWYTHKHLFLSKELAYVLVGHSQMDGKAGCRGTARQGFAQDQLKSGRSAVVINEDRHDHRNMSCLFFMPLLPLTQRCVSRTPSELIVAIDDLVAATTVSLAVVVANGSSVFIPRALATQEASQSKLTCLLLSKIDSAAVLSAAFAEISVALAG